MKTMTRPFEKVEKSTAIFELVDPESRDTKPAKSGGNPINDLVNQLSEIANNHDRVGDS